MKAFVSVVCLLLASDLRGGEPAATTNAVDPAAIVRAARAYSPTVRMAAGEVGVAEARRRQAQGGRMPVLDARAQASRYSGLEPFEWNGVTLLDAIEDRMAVSVGIAVPVYTGGRLSAAARGARDGRTAAEETRRAAESDVTLQALTAYWTWSKAFHGLASLDASVARMEQHAADVRNRRAAGLATEHETLAVEVALDRIRLRLEESRRAEREARAWIAYLTGGDLPPGSVPRQPDVADRGPTPSEPDLVRAALTRRPEVAARRSEASAADATVAAGRGDYLPQVAVVARYEQAKPNLMNLPPQDTWQDDGFVGLLATWILFDGGLTRSRVAEARSRALQARARLDQVQGLVIFQARQARTGLENACERIRVAEHAEASARRSLRAATDLWGGGLARHAEVLDAHAQLTEAEFQVLAARTDAALARAALEHAVGGLQE
jgi:outer membrane protein TolC